MLFVIPIALPLALAVRNRSGGGQRNSRIFVGISDIANILAPTALAMSRMGFVVARIHPNQYTNKDDLKTLFSEPGASLTVIQGQLHSVLSDLLDVFRLLSVIYRCDTVFFLWKNSLWPLNLDYLIYRLAKVRLISQHCGDDVRYRPLHNRLFEQVGVSPLDATPSWKDAVQKFARQRIAEFCGQVISSPDQATFQRKDLYFARFAQSGMKEFPARSFVPHLRVLHAPTDRLVKRTDIFLEASAIVRARGISMDFVLSEGLPNEQILDLLLEIDILVDQPSAWVGRLAVEACSRGAAVIGGNNSAIFPQGMSPIVQFPHSPEELAGILIALHRNRKSLRELQYSCWRFWQNNFSSENHEQWLRQVLSDSAPKFGRPHMWNGIVADKDLSRLENILLRK